MKFTKTKPTQEGFHWCYITSYGMDITDGRIEVGRVMKGSNCYVRTVAGAFDFDWGDNLYWGDPIVSPDSVELPEKVLDKAQD